MTWILISDGDREDVYMQRYPEIVEKREFAEGDIRTLYMARFDSFDKFGKFLDDITKNWTVKIWCPEYTNTSLALACEERALVMEMRGRAAGYLPAAGGMIVVREVTYDKR